MTVMRITPSVTLIDDEVDVNNMKSLAKTLEKMKRVSITANQKITQMYLSLGF